MALEVLPYRASKVAFKNLYAKYLSSQHQGLAAKASCTIVMIDAEKKHSVRIPNEWREAIQQIEGTL